MITAMESTYWKKFDRATPYPVVAGFAVNRLGEFILLYRSGKVRSAKYCWSLPSGLHDIGESILHAFDREINEELSLTRDRRMPTLQLPAYENIPGDGWHWVINSVVVFVNELRFSNNEPEKHSRVAWLNSSNLIYPDQLLGEYPVHSSAIQWYLHNCRTVYQFIHENISQTNL